MFINKSFDYKHVYKHVYNQFVYNRPTLLVSLQIFKAKLKYENWINKKSNRKVLKVDLKKTRLTKDK